MLIYGQIGTISTIACSRINCFHHLEVAKTMAQALSLSSVHAAHFARLLVPLAICRLMNSPLDASNILVNSESFNYILFVIFGLRNVGITTVISGSSSATGEASTGGI